MNGLALVADGSLPGRLHLVTLPGAAPLPDGVELPGLVVRDVRGPVGAGDFATFNVAWQLSRALAVVQGLLGSPLPPLLVRVGDHAAHWPRWAGGHYRLPARRYRVPESVTAAAGEIHLGPGRKLRPAPDGRLWDAGAHNPAIVAHEFGHHVIRHTADPRVNRRADPHDQDNRKTALDEGTADYLAAVLLGTPDIYAWHRPRAARGSPRRRDLDAERTMATFRGGRDADPHEDGSIWASALWAARVAVAERTGAPERFDTLVLDALCRIGASDPDLPTRETRRLRRHFGGALAALLAADGARGAGVGHLVERAFAARGIRAGARNAELRARAGALVG